MKKHDYFYGSQSEQFQFFMVPQVFFTESVYSDLDCDVIILYSIMLRRIGLSRRNGWIDSLNRVYIRYSQKEARKDIRRGKDKVLEAYKVLERHDLIERIDMGVGKPDLIYVKNFVAEDDTDEDEYASDTLGTVPDDSDNQTQDTPCDSELPIRDVDNSAPDAGFQMPWGRKIRLDRDGNSDLKDKILNKHNSDIDNSYPFISCITAGTVGKELPERTNKQNLNQNLSNKSVGGDISNYIQIIQNNIRYPEVMETLSLSDAETYEDMYHVICDTVCSRIPDNQFITIGKEQKPLKIIKSVFLKLKYEHLEYCLRKLQAVRSPVTDMKQYLRTVLYNSYLTMDTAVTQELKSKGII